MGHLTSEPSHAATATRPPSRRGILLGGAACAVCALGGAIVGRATAHRTRSPYADRSRTQSSGSRSEVQPDGLFRVRTDDAVVALTFDDGPDPSYTNDVMRILDRFDIAATFFLIGVNALAHPDLVAEQRRAGHSFGNHTYDHRELELLSADAVDAEIERGQRAIVQAGAPRPKLFRPPKGYTDEVVGVLADAHRYRTVFWDVCVERVVNHQPIDDGVRELIRSIRPGSIVLAHDGSKVIGSGRRPLDRRPTMDALPPLIRGLKAEGFDIVDVPSLLRRTSTAILVGGPAAAAR